MKQFFQRYLPDPHQLRSHKNLRFLGDLLHDPRLWHFSRRSTVRGLARLLRRNPTDAERILWQALTRDRRFAGQFKRQTPVGRHIPDFVSQIRLDARVDLGAL